MQSWQERSSISILSSPSVLLIEGHPLKLKLSILEIPFRAVISFREEQSLNLTSNPGFSLREYDETVPKTFGFGVPCKLINSLQPLKSISSKKSNFSNPWSFWIELHPSKLRVFNLVKDLILLVSSRSLEQIFKLVILGACSRPFRLFNLSQFITILFRAGRSLRPSKLLIIPAYTSIFSNLGSDSMPFRLFNLLQLISRSLSDFNPLRELISVTLSHEILRVWSLWKFWIPFRFFIESNPYKSNSVLIFSNALKPSKDSKALRLSILTSFSWVRFFKASTFFKLSHPVSTIFSNLFILWTPSRLSKCWKYSRSNDVVFRFLLSKPFKLFKALQLFISIFSSFFKEAIPSSSSNSSESLKFNDSRFLNANNGLEILVSIFKNLIELLKLLAISQSLGA